MSSTALSRPDLFNLLNKEQSDRYVDADLQCHYLLHSVKIDQSFLEPAYHTLNRWNETLLELPILDIDQSHPGLTRSFYIPYLSLKRNIYTSLKVLSGSSLL